MLHASFPRGSSIPANCIGVCAKCVQCSPLKSNFGGRPLGVVGVDDHGRTLGTRGIANVDLRRELGLLTRFD